jgi:hypothetical protein
VKGFRRPAAAMYMGCLREYAEGSACEISLSS